MTILLKDEQVLEKAHDTFKRFTAEEELREQYEARWKLKMDQASALGDALEDERLKTARKLKEAGVSPAIISSATNLYLEEINSL